MTEENRWQVPGNGNPFDSTLDEWNENKMSQRSIGVLEYISEQITVDIPQFKSEIYEYLRTVYGHKQNDSVVTHFYRPLEFVGFIRNIDNKLSLSIDGKNFLREIRNQDYDKALNFYILQMLKSSYPNTATKSINLSLFPFRIIFKMLLEKPVPKEWFLTKIPYIRNYEDFKNIEKINMPEYQKWKTWVLPYLEKWGIIEYENNCIQLADYKRELIESSLKTMSFKDMFFETEKEFDKVKNNIRCSRPRNKLLIDSILEEEKYTCFFSKDHRTFPSTNRPNYVEGHHIIPISLNDSFQENLDCKENIIVLCPNCHKAIHLATNEYKESLLNHILENNKKFNKFNLSLEDMKEIYFNKKVPLKV